MKGAILTVGSELTAGRIADTNAAWVASELSRRGIEVSIMLTVDDDISAIRDAWELARARAELVWMTGGMGVTRDDMAVEAIAGALELNLVEDPETIARLRVRHARWGREPDAAAMRQALVPEGATTLSNPVGLAPGLILEADGVLLVALPGVPAEMKAIAEEYVFPRLAARGAPVASRTLHVGGLPESEVDSRIRGVWSSLKQGERIALQAVPGEVLVHMTASGGPGTGAEDCGKRIAGLEEEIRGLLLKAGGLISESPFPVRLVGRLRERGESLALAESVTGGLVAFELSAVAGASETLRGSWVAYQDEAKIRMLGIDPVLIRSHGAVSGQVAREMAGRARTLADTTYGLATTGWAGPGGGNAEDPVGTVYVACAGPGGDVCERFRFGGAREAVRRHAAASSMRVLLAFIGEA